MEAARGSFLFTPLYSGVADIRPLNSKFNSFYFENHRKNDIVAIVDFMEKGTVGTEGTVSESPQLSNSKFISEKGTSSEISKHETSKKTENANKTKKVKKTIKTKKIKKISWRRQQDGSCCNSVSLGMMLFFGLCGPTTEAS